LNPCAQLNEHALLLVFSQLVPRSVRALRRRTVQRSQAQVHALGQWEVARGGLETQSWPFSGGPLAQPQGFCFVRWVLSRHPQGSNRLETRRRATPTAASAADASRRRGRLPAQLNPFVKGKRRRSFAEALRRRCTLSSFAKPHQKRRRRQRRRLLVLLLLKFSRSRSHTRRHAIVFVESRNVVTATDGIIGGFAVVVVAGAQSDAQLRVERGEGRGGDAASWSEGASSTA